MGLKWRSLLFYAGIVLLVQTACSDAARVPKASARVLAEKTGAAHYEERSSEEAQEHHLRKRASDEDFDYEVYQGVVGRPGIDFPILPRIPQTTFSCRTFGNGYFADLETECQVFHICDDGRKISFLCPNGTIFQQSELICDWWFKVNCPASPGHYAESAEMLSRSQGRKRPSYTKKIENEFHSNGNGYSRTTFNEKSQYPIKKDNRRFEDSPDRASQGKKKSHRFESDEVPSLENFDFEDISDNRQESGKLKTSKPDPSDGEMQDVAESASFVGNGQRRNGYNYDNLHEGQKPYDDRKGYDRTKNGRGRQKYRGDVTKPPRGRSQNLGEGPEENSFTTRDRATTGRGGVTRKFENESHSTPGLIHQKRPTLATTSPQTTRDRTGSHTTPRRLDNSRTTPYYTPTVPTIRATQTSTPQKTEFGDFPTTTGLPSGISASKDSPAGSRGNLAFGGNLDHPQRIPGDAHTGVTGSVSTSGNGQANVGVGITSTFAVSGPPAVTIPPHDHSFESQKTGPSSTSFGTQGLPTGTVSPLDNSFKSQKTGSFGTQEPPIQDSTGYSYQSPSKSSQNKFVNSSPSPLRPSQSVTGGAAGAGFSGTPQDTGSSKNGAGIFGSKPNLDIGGGAQVQVSTGSQKGAEGLRNGAGYSYKTPSKQTEGSTKPGASVQIQSTQGRVDAVGKSTGDQSISPSKGFQIGSGPALSERGGASGSSSGSPGFSNETTSTSSLPQREGVSADSGQGTLQPSLSQRGGVSGDSTQGALQPSLPQRGGASVGATQGGLQPSLPEKEGASADSSQGVLQPSLSQRGEASVGATQGGLQPSLLEKEVASADSSQGALHPSLSQRGGVSGDSTQGALQPSLSQRGEASVGATQGGLQPSLLEKEGASADSSQGALQPSLSQRGGVSGDSTQGALQPSLSQRGGLSGDSTQGALQPSLSQRGEASVGATQGGLQPSLLEKEGASADSSQGALQPSLSQRGGVSGDSTQGALQPSLSQRGGLSGDSTQGALHPSLSQRGGVSGDSTQGALQPSLSQRGGLSGDSTQGAVQPSLSQRGGVSGDSTQGALQPSLSQRGGASVGSTQGGLQPSLSQRGGVSEGSNQGNLLPSLSVSGGVQGNVGGDSKLSDVRGTGGAIVGNLKPTGRGKIQSPILLQGTEGNVGGNEKDGINLQTAGQRTGSPLAGSITVTGRSGIGTDAGLTSNTSPTVLSVGQKTSSGAGGGKPEGEASFSGTSITPTPLVIGMRGTIPTDPAHKGADSSSPIIAVNVLSDGSFGGKISVPSLANSVHGSVSDGSSIKPTTFKPFTSSSIYQGKVSTINGQGFSGSTYLPKDETTVRPSSAGPTYLPKPTKSSKLPESVSEHVDEMIKTLSDLKDGIGSTKNRAGLEIPPSSGPETLHSLALYFAGEGDNASTTTETGEPTATVKADINAVPLSNKTVQQYEALFGLGSTTDRAAETTLTPDLQSRNSNDLDAQHSTNLLGDAGGKGETRKIAQVFTNALSAYLEDPATFRKALTEVRPTEPPSTEENEVTTQTRTTSAYFNKGTAASYLPTAPTTVFPSTTTDDLEVLDFSDVTISTGQRGKTPFPDSTAEAPTTGSTSLKGGLNRIPASSLAAAKREKQGKNLRGGDETTSNQIAVEINKGLGLSTVAPFALDSGKTGLPRGSAGIGISFSTTSSPEGTTTNLPLIFDLLPPVSGGKPSNLGPPSFDILPPGYDDDEDTLQRAQSQSFVASRNRLGKGDTGKSDKGIKSGTKTPGHYITRLISDTPTTTEYPGGVSPWFLDPLTINDGLMDEFRTTTASPFTYLPKVPSSTTETSPVHLDLTSMLNRVHLTDPKADRLGKALPGIPEDLLPPENGMQRIANKVFGSLNESSADHLMNVMKKAEDNPTVRRLILLLIQTCGDDDYSKTVEQSRQALLNALIGMDDNLGLEDDVEVIRLRPKQNRRGKSIDSSDRNSVRSSTTEYPVTTFRRDISSYTASTENPGSTTQNPLDETTRFEIRVEDPDEGPSTTTTEQDILNLSTTTTRPGQETTPSYSTSDSSVSTISPLNFGDVPRVSGSRRTPKDVDTSLSQPSLSHKSSDERALELLKSLYSLASKFGRR